MASITPLVLAMSTSTAGPSFNPQYTMSSSPSSSTPVLDLTLLKRKRSQSHSHPLLPMRKRSRSCSALNHFSEWSAIDTSPPFAVNTTAEVTVTRPRKSSSLLRAKRIPRTAGLPLGSKEMKDQNHNGISSTSGQIRSTAPLPLRQLKSNNRPGMDSSRIRLPQPSRQNERISNHVDRDVHVKPVDSRKEEEEVIRCPSDLIMAFDYGVSDGSIAPCFYPGATIPLIVRSTHLLPPSVQARIRTVLICNLNQPINGEIVRLEKWYDASTLSNESQQRLSLVLPLARGGPASYDTPDGIFEVGWTLYVELHVVEAGERRLAAAFNRALTILPSSSPTPPVLLERIELHPSAQLDGKNGKKDAEALITGWTPNAGRLQVKLDALSYSPNSIVPLHLDFRPSPADLTARSTDHTDSDTDEVVQVEAKLVRTQRIHLSSPGQPDHSRSTSYIISHLTTSIPSTSSGQIIRFHLTTEDGSWPFGYTTSLRLDGCTHLSNMFKIELTVRQGVNIGYRSIPIVIGSVAEPSGAMYILRGGGMSNENGWKVPPPAYGMALKERVYTLDSQWTEGSGH